MTRNLVSQYSDEELDIEVTRELQGVPQSRLRRWRKAPRSERALIDEMIAHGNLSEASGVFSPTFTSSRHEREWILNYLGPFYDEHKITDVLRRVKGGKEANVYCCAAHPDTGLTYVAAKVYRPRMFRNLRNDARYRQGRSVLDQNGKEVRDARYRRALEKGTHRGKDLQHTSWLEHEYHTLEILSRAGADVPEPLATANNTILMEYVGAADRPAPTLIECQLPAAEAARVFERLLWNIELMLAQGRVHGDLSAYNVLYWEGRFKIIDFPQAIDPRVNREGYDIFARDVNRICQHFRRYAIESEPKEIARMLWEQYGPPEELPAEMIEIAEEPLQD